MLFGHKIQQAKIASQKLAKKVKKFYPDIRFSNFKVNNFCGIKKYNCWFALAKLYFSKFQKVVYEPEISSWLILKLSEKMRALISNGGKVLIVGAKSDEEL